MLIPTPRPKGTVFEKRKGVRESDPGAAHLDKMLDEALRETFPASDPVAITIETPLKAIALDDHGSRKLYQYHRTTIYSSASLAYGRVGKVRLS
jgi:hypothetical protein